MDSIFSEISEVIIIATAVSIIMKWLKQPLILGYILSGLLVGPTGLDLIHTKDTFEAFSHIGIALLLFIIGLGLSFSIIKKLGKVVFIAALAELVVVSSLGYLVATALGYSNIESFIIGLSLFFSSTIIIVKVLTDKREQGRLHGQIAIGIILLDDIVATLALLFVAAGNNSTLSVSEVALLFFKGALLLGFLAYFSTKLLPKISRFMASSQELLFLAAISWGFGIATLFDRAGFSIEVGALFAGVSLASLPYAQEISSRLKPLRDFFVVLFFVVLGESLNVSNLASGIVPALLLSAIVIALKPITVTTVLGWMGYTKRVSFKTGINVSQISEFSIVLVVLAVNVGLISASISAIITLVAIITIASSTYLMQYDDELFTRFDRLNLRLFEKTATHIETRELSVYPILLFGYQKGGYEFVRVFRQMKERFLVVDYDPLVIEMLEHRRLPHVYGDATDIELLDEINVRSAKLVISTMTEFESNEQLVRHVHKLNPQAIIILSADNYEEALKLYHLGSTYVMMPHYIGSEKVSTFVKEKGFSKAAFKKSRDHHLKSLEKQFGKLEKKDAAQDKKLGKAVLEGLAALTKVKS